MDLNPVKVLKEGAEEQKGEDARMSSFVGAIALCDMMSSTLGPKGMDKILQSAGPSGGLSITNDGATILKSVVIDNPAARVLIDISKVQDEDIGDGTTTVCVLAGQLLREAEKLLDKHIHPMTVIEGYREACAVAREALSDLAVDNTADHERFRADLINIAKTTLSSKILDADKNHFAELAVDAVLRLEGGTDLSHIHILKRTGGSLDKSYLSDGFILDKQIMMGCPKRIENAKIMIANTQMDADKIKIWGSKVKTDSQKKLAEIEKAESERMVEKCQSILDHGINVFINRNLVYDLPARFFGDNQVAVIENAETEGIERLSLVTGADIASTFGHPDQVKLGTASVVEEILIGEDICTRFSGVTGRASTIVLRGASQHVLDEAERSLHDALSVLSQTVNRGRVIPGGGCTEMAMAKRVIDLAARTPGKKALAIEAFGRALTEIPTILATNAGLDAADLVAELRAKHAETEGNCTYGLDIMNAGVGDMREMGICESYYSKDHSLSSASEAAEQIIRVDEIIKAAPPQRQ